jgi:nicotinamidase-related amidase
MTLQLPTSAARARHLVCLDLLTGALPPRAARVGARFQRPIDNCRGILRHARTEGWDITHVHGRSATAALGRPVEGLEPLPSEPVLYRDGVSAFSNKTFRRIVEARSADLIIVGFSLSPTCMATALTAHDWRLSVTVLEDALQPSLVAAPDIEALRTVVGALPAPGIWLARTESFTGPTPHLRLVACG